MIRRAGFRLIDSDALIRDCVLKDESVKTAIREKWGMTMIGADGEVDRSALGAVVFKHETALQSLEAMTHPVLFGLWRKELRADPSAGWVIEVPLLFEKGLENWFDFTVCVASTKHLQLTRLEQRGLPRELAEQRISKQLPLARKIDRSDFVVWNEGSLDFLQSQVDLMVAALPVSGR
jgi:dephospho-CoA kinase